MFMDSRTCLQVIEPNWHVMHNRLQTAKSIDEVWSSSYRNSCLHLKQRKKKCLAEKKNATYWTF